MAIGLATLIGAITAGLSTAVSAGLGGAQFAAQKNMMGAQQSQAMLPTAPAGTATPMNKNRITTV